MAVQMLVAVQILVDFFIAIPVLKLYSQVHMLLLVTWRFYDDVSVCCEASAAKHERVSSHRRDVYHGLSLGVAVSRQCFFSAV